MQAELRDVERAVTSGTRDAGRGLGAEFRRRVTSGRLGQTKHLDTVGLVYTKAPQIVRVFDEGAVIRSRRGSFLANPTENAPRKGSDGRRIRPSTFPEHRFGPLRLVPRPSGPLLLGVDGLRASLVGRAGAQRLPACDRPRSPQRIGPDHGGDVLARAAGEVVHGLNASSLAFAPVPASVARPCRLQADASSSLTSRRCSRSIAISSAKPLSRAMPAIRA
jgi:hypothetical protein